MFFLLSKILAIFLFPLPVAILLGFLASWKIQGAKNKVISIIPILLLWASSSFPVCQYLIETLEIDHPPKSIKSIESADAIVVLGGMINILTKHQDRIELGGSVERLTDAAMLWKAKKAKVILISGGSGVLFYQGKSEAQLAKKFLVEIGVDEKAILTEEKSRNTAENAFFTYEILQEKKIKKIILITSAFHMKRSLALFEKRGFEIETFPTDYRALLPVMNWDAFVPTVGGLDTTSSAIKEWVGIFVYKFQGYMD